MTDLERFRDYARAMSRFTPGKRSDKCAGNHNPWTVTTHRKPDHEACPGTSSGCRCSCHHPSKRERALWKQLADEVDAYLAPAHDEPMLEVP